MLLLAAMFVAVHRGARGRSMSERISEARDRREAAEVEKEELAKRVEFLRGRNRVVRAAARLGLHMPSEDELVIIDLSTWKPRGRGAGS
jgi:Flp pilus assembly protein TadB